MKKMICLLMVFTYVLSMNMGAIAEENEETNEVHVMWIKKYANIVEMADDAELVVKGIVTETVLEAPKESPLLEKENEYILFLKQNTNLNSYYIIGAGQGVFDGEFIEDDLDYQEIIESLNLDFANKLSSLTYSARTIETPSSGNKWNKTNLTYDIGYHLYVDSAYLTAVGNGASSWNGIAGISLTEITSGDADIQIRYDVQGIDSICSYAVNTTSGTTITKSYIN